MKFLSYPDETNRTPTVATVGFFDGVHRGHLFLIGQVKRLACERGMASLLVTFDSHPRQVMQHDYQPRLLSTLFEKRRLLQASGADACALLHFTPELARLTAREFMERVLRDGLGVKMLVVGYDHRFGRDRADGFEDYVRYGRELGIEVVRAEACRVGQVNVSSSVTRAFVSEGEMEMAARCLGRPYELTGRVVPGFHVGRELGFPTANLQPDDPLKLVPARGVYAVRVYGALPENRFCAGMLNIGMRPTLENGDAPSIEVHLLGFSGDLYDCELRVEFVRRLRDEKKFRSRAELVRQLQADAGRVAALLENIP